MERCRGQAAMVHADHVNSWWGVELLIPLLKHTEYYYFCVKSMCRPMPTRGKSHHIAFLNAKVHCITSQIALLREHKMTGYIMVDKIW